MDLKTTWIPGSALLSKIRLVLLLLPVLLVTVINNGLHAWLKQVQDLPEWPGKLQIREPIFFTRGGQLNNLHLVAVASETVSIGH